MLRGVYPIVNITPSAGFDAPRVQAYVSALLTAKPMLIQLRAKGASSAALRTMAAQMMQWLSGTGTELVINDAPDVADSVSAPWVHVGQGDVSVTAIRAKYPKLRIGVSTHSLAQLAEALGTGCDYAAFGPVWTTRSKADAQPAVGLDGLACASDVARAAKVPLVAIGGIELLNAHEIAKHASMGAVISCLERAESPSELATSLHAVLGGLL
jgi:thiamine-phosphate pyrophosphorylase